MIRAGVTAAITLLAAVIIVLVLLGPGERRAEERCREEHGVWLSSALACFDSSAVLFRNRQ